MVKRGLLICLTIILIASPLFSQTIITRTYSGNLYSEWFTEPFEILYIAFWDGVIRKVTNNLPHKIYADLDALVRESGHQYSDIMLVIHNHWIYPKASPADKRTYITMKRKGFRGWFLIYRQSTNEVLMLGEKKDATKQ